jgi:hypothetical protein
MILSTALLMLLAIEPGAAPADAPLGPPDQTIVRRRAQWVALTGGVLVVGGATVWIIGTRQYLNANRPDHTPGQIQVEQESALHNSLGGIGLVSVGICALGVAVAMWQLSLAGPTSVSFSPMPGGGALVIGGSLP